MIDRMIPVSVAVTLARSGSVLPTDVDACQRIAEAIQAEAATIERDELIDGAIREMASECFEASERKGFWEGGDGRNRGEMIALMHSELSEMLEAVRQPGCSEKCRGFTAEEEEAADVLIRLLDYCGGWGLDLAGAYRAKRAHNDQRPHKHGKAF